MAQASIGSDLQAILDSGNIASSSKTFTFPNRSGTFALSSGSLTSGSVLFADSNGNVSQDNSNLFWDDTNNRLGIGTSSATQRLHVEGNTLFSGPAGSWVVGTAHHLFKAADGQPLAIQHTANDAAAAVVLYDDNSVIQGFFGWYNSGAPIGTASSFVQGTANANPIQFYTNNTSRWKIDGSGHLIATTDNTYDIGASGATRPRNLYLAGTATFSSRILEAQGADVASTNNLVLGLDGNTFEITGTTQINLIANTDWQNGSRITLLFTSTPTVKHNQTTSGSNITIQLAGAADFVATAGDTLTLLLCEIGGTQAWREVSRAVI